MLGSAVFAIISLIAACLVKTRERLMGIGQILTMPLFFASNAVYPLTLMPGWLRAVSILNPLTYQVHALRALMIQGGVSAFGLGVDYAVQIVSVVGLVLVPSRVYPRLVTRRDGGGRRSLPTWELSPKLSLTPRDRMQLGAT